LVSNTNVLCQSLWYLIKLKEENKTEIRDTKIPKNRIWLGWWKITALKATTFMKATKEISSKSEACAFFHCQEDDNFLLLNERD
jgi:hypothetical protein